MTDRYLRDMSDAERSALTDDEFDAMPWAPPCRFCHGTGDGVGWCCPKAHAEATAKAIRIMDQREASEAIADLDDTRREIFEHLVAEAASTVGLAPATAKNVKAPEADESIPVRLYTLPMVCKTLSIGRSTVYRLISSGELETVTIGDRRLVPTQALDAYIVRLLGGRL